MDNTTLLFVDDEEKILRSLNRVFIDEPYETISVNLAEQVMDVIDQHQIQVVLLDITMPNLNGYDICKKIKSSKKGELIQVILLSGHCDIDARLKGYQAGADDYITKPFDNAELKAKVEVQLRLREALSKLASQNNELEERVQQRTEQITETRDLTVFAMAKLAESRDPETGEHLERLRYYSQILARHLVYNGAYQDEIDELFLENMYRASPLHDIGKVGIPDTILLKPARLNYNEFEIMKQHTIIGGETLKIAAEHSNSGDFLLMASDVALYHHEHFDGSGYPNGLKAFSIPLSARIVALADVYDALTSVRVYKSAFDPTVAKSMIELEKGKQFDPKIVEAFCSGWDEFLGVRGLESNCLTDFIDIQISNNLRR